MTEVSTCPTNNPTTPPAPDWGKIKRGMQALLARPPRQTTPQWLLDFRKRASLRRLESKRMIYRRPRPLIPVLRQSKIARRPRRLAMW